MHIADRDLPMGTLMRMGPGNFPLWLGAILAFFGLYIAARGLWRSPPGTRAEVTWEWRPVTCIVAAMLAFGCVMPRAGLVPALLVMFLIATLAGRDYRWREILAMTVLMTLFAIVVFVVLLKLPFQLVRGYYLV
jgi:hypothetical protein